VASARWTTLVGLALCLLTAVAGAQPKGKEHAFSGKIEKIDTGGKRLVVNHMAVEGWMGAMTMAYKVDKVDAVLKVVKVGDAITAKVYDGDFTLYEVKVVLPPPSTDKAPPKK
jgi:Cu/Ag efflux protein CusF